MIEVRLVALVLLGAVVLIAKGSGGRRAADAAEARVLAAAEAARADAAAAGSASAAAAASLRNMPPLPPLQAGANAERSAVEVEADAALERVNAATVPRPMARAATLASITIQAGLATATAMPLANALLNMGPAPPALRGAGLLVLLALTLGHHLAALGLAWRAAWRLDWRTTAATARKAFGPAGAAGSLARASTALGTRSGGTLVKTRGAAFDWSAFPDEDSDDEREAAAAAAAGLGPAASRHGTGNGTGVRRNPVYDLASGSDTLQPGKIKGARAASSGHVEAEYLAAPAQGTTAGANATWASRREGGNEELYTVTEPLAEGAAPAGSFEVIRLEGTIFSHRSASEEIQADAHDDDGAA